MNRGMISKKCGCRRYKITWLCTFPNCSDSFFCKKCRKNHNRRHEENFYPIRELLEDDQEEDQDSFEFEKEEKEKLFCKIDDEIEKLQDEFDEKMKEIRKKQRQNINEFTIKSNSKSQQNALSEYRRKVLDNPHDETSLKKLGREYHKSLQESNVQNVDRRKIFEKYKDDINHRYDNFNDDLQRIFKFLADKRMYPTRNGISKEKLENSEEMDLVESEVRNSTIPKEWDKEDPMDEVNKSLHIIRQNTYNEKKKREE